MLTPGQSGDVLTPGHVGEVLTPGHDDCAPGAGISIGLVVTY